MSHVVNVVKKSLCFAALGWRFGKVVDSFSAQFYVDSTHCQKILSARPRAIGATPQNGATLITDFNQ